MEPQCLGRYQLGEEIGRGGMSIVYRGNDPVLERSVALKVLHPHLAQREESRIRFSREARAVARLNHPNIVEVFDYSPPESEQAYIVTEYVDGPTLRQFIMQHPLRYGEQAAMLMIPVVSALQCAHEAGIIHRDVKPENIMIRADGSPVLMDFGIAQMVDMETLTATGTMLGSPAHMAPEVIDGLTISPASDIFSLGTVLYWLVCGALPFSGPTPSALFRRVLECQYDPVLQRRPSAGRAIARLIEQCLSKDPKARPTAQGVEQALRNLLQDAHLEATTELQAFLADPEPYQDHLALRMAPALAQSAQAALAKKNKARALDFLDRALSLDESCEEAKTLLHRIEHGENRALIIKISLHVLVTAALLVLGILAWPSISKLFEDETPPTAQTESDSSPTVTIHLLDAGVPQVQTVQVTPSTPEEPQNVSEKPVQAIIPLIERRPNDRKPRPARTTPKEPEFQPLHLAIHGRYKGAQIFLNDQPQGYLAAIENKGGLLLDKIGNYTVRIENKGCEPNEQTIRVNKDTTRLPSIAFECNPLPAQLHITSNRMTAIRDAQNRLLGRTNQVVSVPMTALKIKMPLTIGEPTGEIGAQLRTVTLKAGETVVEEVYF